MSFEELKFLENPVKIGTVLAMIISWSRNKSILMAVVHGIFSWLYVIYYYIGRDEDEDENNEENQTHSSKQ